MRIVLNGVGFVNKGAEALLRTVQAELARRVPDAEFFLWRIPGRDWQPALAGGMRPLLLPIDMQSSMWRLLGGRIGKVLWSTFELCRTRDMRQISVVFDRKNRFSRACGHYLRRTLESIHALIDISGFAYGDVWGLSGFQRIRPLVEDCLGRGTPVVFLPQAWGSFDSPKVREAIRELVGDRGVSFYSRDESSCRHLERALGKPNGAIASYPDIVFRFQGGTPEQGAQILRRIGCSMRRPIVGISPNIRVFNSVPGNGTGNQYVQALTKLADHCLESHDVDVVLQANEVREHPKGRDDRYLCSMVSAMVNRADRCFTISESLSAEATKALIGRFEFLVGSRFHSLVFALSQGVPGMSVSWAHKYRELFALFGMESNVHECRDIDAGALVATFERCWRERRQQGEMILAEVKHLQMRVDALFDEVGARILGDPVE